MKLSSILVIGSSILVLLVVAAQAEEQHDQVKVNASAERPKYANKHWNSLRERLSEITTNQKEPDQQAGTTNPAELGANSTAATAESSSTTSSPDFVGTLEPVSTSKRPVVPHLVVVTESPRSRESYVTSVFRSVRRLFKRVFDFIYGVFSY